MPPDSRGVRGDGGECAPVARVGLEVRAVAAARGAAAVTTSKSGGNSSVSNASRVLGAGESGNACSM